MTDDIYDLCSRALKAVESIAESQREVLKMMKEETERRAKFDIALVELAGTLKNLVPKLFPQEH